jgi:Ran GTPase-activating protein (RanGAP) involved in mRNA processing and transport
MATTTQSTPTHGKIKVSSPFSPSIDSPSSSEVGKEMKRDGSSSQLADQPHSSSLLRLVHEKNLQSHVTSDSPQIRHTSGAFLRQYSGMQGVPEIEGMQQSEAPLEEIEVKTVIELFGITVTRPVIPPPRAVKSVQKKKEGDGRLSLRVHIQDHSYRMVNTYKKHTGYDLLLQCADELGCEAPQYFNLCRRTEEGVDRWLDLNMTLDGLGLEEGDSVHFKIKYYKQPAFKLDDVSLQLFFVQTKLSILSGNYIVPERLALLLAAFQLQIFYGTYDPTAPWLPGLASNLIEFLPADQLATGEPQQWADRIIQYYQHLYDLTSHEATYGYLAIARRVPACGAFLFPVLQGKLHVTIGIVEDGVIFFKDDKKSMFEFFSFDDLLAWANTETGVALRLQKKIDAPSSGDASPTTQSNTNTENEYFQMRVNYDCTENQSLTIIDLLEGYNMLLSRKSQERQYMLVSEGLRPVATPGAYVSPARRVQDEPFGSKLDFFLSAYRHACASEGVLSCSAILNVIDALEIPGKLTSLRLPHRGLDIHSSTALLHAIEQTQRYRSSVGDRTITHNFELTSINVAKNKIAPAFPSVASFLPSITELDLSSNTIPKEEMSTFVNSFKGVTSLVSLSLAESELNDKTVACLIPLWSRCLGLESLDLSANALKSTSTCLELGKMIQQLPRFRKLSLQKNKLGDSAVEAFFASLELPSSPAAVSTANMVNSSSAGSLAVPNTHAIAASTATGRDQNRNGYNFDFRSTGISSKAVIAMAAYIKKERNVRVLRLAGNGISSCSALSDVLKENVNLLVLDVGGCDFGKKGWTELLAGVAKQSGSDRFDATGGMEKTGWNAFRLFMREVTSRVSHFEFQNYTISSQAIVCLSDILSHPLCFVSKLVLKGSTFAKKDFNIFTDIIASAPTLMSLDLSSCKLDNTNAVAIANALANNTALTYLSLNDNIFTDISAIEEIAKALQENHSLEYLSLRRCSIPADAIPCWSDCVSFNHTLQIVDLRGNNINLDVGTRALLQSVPCAADIVV